MNALNTLWRNPIALGIAAFALLILITSTFAIVPETRQGVVLRFGEPVRIIRKAGFYARVPFAEQFIWIDKRVRDVDMERQQVLSTDQLRLNVDAFARYRVVDPLQMFKAARTEDRVSDALRPILGSALRNELGKRPFAALLSPERGQVMQNIKVALDVVARQYGAEIVDVRIKKTDLPEGTPLDSAFERMRTARKQEALTIQAQGLKQAQIVRADADAQASGVYAQAFNKDPDFYDFYRAMQSYRHTFGVDGSTAAGQASIILSPNNDYLREFRGGGR